MTDARADFSRAPPVAPQSTNLNFRFRIAPYREERDSNGRSDGQRLVPLCVVCGNTGVGRQLQHGRV